MPEIGVNKLLLKKIIKAHGSYEKAAKALEVSRTLLWRLDHGTYKQQIKETTRFKIADKSGVDHDELFPVLTHGRVG